MLQKQFPLPLLNDIDNETFDEEDSREEYSGDEEDEEEIPQSKKSILIKNYFTYFKKISCFKKILGKPKWLTIRTLLVLRKKILKTSNFFLKIRINFLKISKIILIKN